MKIDQILNDALKADYTDVVLNGDLPPIGIVGDERGLIPGHEKPLTKDQWVEVIDELVKSKGLELTPAGLTFPYTDLEHSDYKVSTLGVWAHFARVPKSSTITFF